MPQEGLRERKKTKTSEIINKTENERELEEEPLFGPVPSFPNQRFWTRLLLIFGTLVVVYFTSGQERVVIFAKQNEKLNHRKQEIPCNKTYLGEVSKLLGEDEKVRCGRIVMDNIVRPEEAKILAEIVRKGLKATGEPAGSASIIELHTGALSAGRHFINFYSFNDSIFDSEDYAIYRTVKRKVQEAISVNFDLPPGKLFLTQPTFFSRLTAKPPVTLNDEYWHSHVDKVTYESFHYTALVYLNDFGIDFEGGRFIFEDPENVTTIIEPKRARVLMFSSGGENVHRIEKVTSGQRLAVTIAFTCDERKAISDPKIDRVYSQTG